MNKEFTDKLSEFLYDIADVVPDNRNDEFSWLISNFPTEYPSAIREIDMPTFQWLAQHILCIPQKFIRYQNGKLYCDQHNEWCKLGEIII